MTPKVDTPVEVSPGLPIRAPKPLLLSQLRWMVSLRWLAGAAVVIGGVIEQQFLHWYAVPPWWIAGIGVTILAYNVVFRFLQRARKQGVSGRAPWSRMQLYGLAWTQIIVDLVCLTALVVLTGKYQSPLRGFFVFHMVFASLLMPRLMAYAAALAAVVLVEGTLMAAAGPPTDIERGLGLGWDVTLVTTVFFSTLLTNRLQRQRRRLTSQNRRIRAMSARLRQQQQALVQQEKMFAMGQLAAGVAHEVSNPLASMDGLLQLLERRPEKITPESLVRLRDQVARVNQIVRQLTSFAHPGEAQWQQANLNDVVMRALEVLRFDRRLKPIAIEKSLDGRMPLMRLQPAALEQVIINIVINAADAMEGVLGAKLGIRTEVAGSEVRVVIYDNGCGMTPEVKQRVFDPFFTTKPVGKGTGLGLSISYSLVKKHGGEITVESAPGKGATFMICLPAPQAREGGSKPFVTPENVSLK